MALRFRVDPNLQVLEFADNKSLAILVRHLTHDESGNVRSTQALLAEVEFRNAGEDLLKVWKLIGAELQHYGGDSLANAVRRKGVTYREILTDVCKSMWLHVDEKKSTVQIENDLVSSLHQLLWMASPRNVREKLTIPFEVPNAFSEEIERHVGNDLSEALRLGIWISTYIDSLRFMLLFDELRSRSLSTPIAGGAARILTDAFAGKLLLDVSGPAFEVTTPAVFFIAYLRRKLSHDVY